MQTRFFEGVAAAVRILVLTADVDAVVIGGGLSALGDPLLDGVRAALAGGPPHSPFLASLDLAERVHIIPLGFPAAAVGLRRLTGSRAMAEVVIVPALPTRPARSSPTPSSRSSPAVRMPCSASRRVRRRCRTYRALAGASVPSGSTLTRVRGFALDEYVGLPVDHPESYHSVIRREVVEPLGLDAVARAGARRRATASSPRATRYEAAIIAAGRRRPADPRHRHERAHRVQRAGFLVRLDAPAWKTLTEQTRRDNARFFDSIDDVPTHCITQGLGTIMRARHLVLLAFGEGKAEAVAEALEGPITASLPAPRSSCTRTSPSSSTRPRHRSSRTPTTTGTRGRCARPGVPL